MNKTRDKQFLKAGITGKLESWEDPRRHYFKKTSQYTLAGSTYTIAYIGSSNGIGLKDMVKNTTQLKDEPATEIVLKYVIGNKFNHEYKESVNVDNILNAPVHPVNTEGVCVKLEHGEFCLNPKYLRALKYMDGNISVEYSGKNSPLRFKSKGKKFVIMPIRIQ